MKSLVIILITLFSQFVFSQTLTQEEKDTIISKLDNARWAIRSEAIIDIYQQNIPEALPKLEEKIFQQEKDIALFYLLAIDKYNSPNVIGIANKFIDTIAYLGDYLNTENVYELKAEAVRILFERGDYSRTPLLFEYIEAKKPDIAIIPFGLLSDVINNVPEYKEQAKAEFRRIMLNINDDYYAPMSLISLSEISSDEIIPDLLFVMENSNSSTMKNIAYEELEKRNYPNMENLTKEQFISDPERSWMMLNKILLEYNTPANYKFVLNNYKSVLSSDQIAKYDWLFKSNRSIPPRDYDLLSNYLDFVYSLCDTLSVYIWLADLQFKDELQSFIQSAKSSLQTGDSLSCAVNVKEFQDLVDNVYKDSLNADPRFVTLEGWKFLYWNAQYILDRLPTPPVVVLLELNEITPAMSMKNQPGAFTMELKGSGFSSSSVVYFNGNVRTTTYVSDNTLTAQILASDISAAGNFPVWVSNGTTNSDTLTFNVVNNLPNEILPVMNCVTNNGNGTYTAYFGYNNKNSVSVFIPIYAQNKISPDPWDRGQPGVFKVGVQERVFSVTWTSGNIIWHLNNKTAKAKTNSPPCP